MPAREGRRPRLLQFSGPGACWPPRLELQYPQGVQLAEATGLTQGTRAGRQVVEGQLCIGRMRETPPWRTKPCEQPNPSHQSLDIRFRGLQPLVGAPGPPQHRRRPSQRRPSCRLCRLFGSPPPRRTDQAYLNQRVRVRQIPQNHCAQAREPAPRASLLCSLWHPARPRCRLCPHRGTCGSPCECPTAWS